MEKLVMGNQLQLLLLGYTVDSDRHKENKALKMNE